MPNELIKIDPVRPEVQIVQKAAQVLQAGGVIAFPTDTSYGLGVNPYNNQAVEKVYKLKGRNFSNPLLLLISDEQQLAELAEDVSPAVRKLISIFWPGPLTLIFQATPKLRKFQIGVSGKVGVRLPDSLIACSIIDAAQIPLTATSANPSGQPSSFSARGVSNYFSGKLDLIIDAGANEQGLDSTVLDVSVSPAKLLREGAISIAKLSAVFPLS